MRLGSTILRSVELPVLLACGLAGWDYRGWQARSIKLTEDLNNLMARGEFDTAYQRYRFELDAGSFSRLNRERVQSVIFSGTRVEPLTAWGYVEVRMVVCQDSDRLLERVVWDVGSAEPRLVQLAITPLERGKPSQH